MRNSLAILGAPSSAGAYAPGQEKAPAAIRAAGLLDMLSDQGIMVTDHGDVAGFRWQVDQANPRAMNAISATKVAKSVAEHVASALVTNTVMLVLGGDCTVELGTVAGVLRENQNIGLVYIDLDTDLNTPTSITDGALDWMGVAHLLGLENTVPALAGLGPRMPLLFPNQILFFANDNSTPFERQLIDDLGISEVPFAKVVADPSGAAQAAASGWASQFEQLLVHLDVDVLDYLDMPLAENTRRNEGLRFDQLMAALRPFLQAPNWVALTISEVNPDHGNIDGATLRTFAHALTEAIATSPKLQHV